MSNSPKKMPQMLSFPTRLGWPTFTLSFLVSYIQWLMYLTADTKNIQILMHLPMVPKSHVSLICVTGEFYGILFLFCVRKENAFAYWMSNF